MKPSLLPVVSTTFSLEAAQDLINAAITTELISFCSSVDVRFTDYEPSGVRYNYLQSSRSHPQFQCNLNLHELTDPVTSGAVSDTVLCGVVKHVMHEARHIYQMSNLYQQKNLNPDVVNMARIDACSLACNGYGSYMYRYTPSEIDAEKWGLLNTVNFFNTTVVNNFGNPVIDSKQCLFEYTRRLDRWCGDLDAESFDEMIVSLDDAFSECGLVDRPYPFSSRDQFGIVSMVKKYCPKWLDIIENSNKQGVEFDKQLFAMVRDASPSWINLHAGLDSVVKESYEEYPSLVSPFEKPGYYFDRWMTRRDLSSAEQELFATAAEVEANSIVNDLGCEFS